MSLAPSRQFNSPRHALWVLRQTGFADKVNGREIWYMMAAPHDTRNPLAISYLSVRGYIFRPIVA